MPKLSKRSANLFSVICEGLEQRQLLSATFGEIKPFLVTDGQYPIGPLVADSSGNLYGVTKEGGQANSVPFQSNANSLGVVFKLTKTIVTDSGVSHPYYNYSVLAAFSASTGGTPAGGLTIDSAGNLFGTTTTSAAGTDGSVFEVEAGKKTITTLANFQSGSGASPVGAMVMDSTGNLFGLTSTGGTNAMGSLFEVLSTGSGSFGSSVFTEASFTGANGQHPAGGLAIDSSGNLYGTTQAGGGNSNGEVFKISPTHLQTITPIYSFGSGSDGFGPASTPLLVGNTLYATTSGNRGTIFKLDLGNNNAFTQLADFASTSSTGPTSLVLDNQGSGNLYGEASAITGTDGDILFSVPSAGGAVTAVSGIGELPSGGLLQTADGSLFGALPNGGGSGYGSIFEYGDPVPTEVLSLTFKPNAITQSPITATTGVPLSTAILVDGNDQSGSLNTTVAPLITLSVATAPAGGGLLGGTDTVLATNGVATFSNVIFYTPGTYVLNATEPNTGGSTAIKVTVNVSDDGGGGGGTTTSSLTSTIVKSAIPTSAVGGVAFKGSASVNVTNGGSSTNVGKDTVALYASTTGSIDSASTKLASSQRKLSIKAGASSKVNLKFAKLSLPAGNYTLFTQVTDANGTASSRNTGLTINVAAPIIALDGEISNNKPQTIIPGKLVAFTLRIENTGNIFSTGLATITLGLSADGIVLTVPVKPITKKLTIRPNVKAITLKLSFKVPSDANVGYVPGVTFTQGDSTFTVA